LINSLSFPDGDVTTAVQQSPPESPSDAANNAAVAILQVSLRLHGDNFLALTALGYLRSSACACVVFVDVVPPYETPSVPMPDLHA
jgi:hypothetical protein